MKALILLSIFVASFAMFVMYSMDFTPKGAFISGTIALASILLLKREVKKTKI